MGEGGRSLPVQVEWRWKYTLIKGNEYDEKEVNVATASDEYHVFSR